MRTIIYALVNLVRTAILNFKMATTKYDYSPYLSLRGSQMDHGGGGGCMGTPVGSLTIGELLRNGFGCIIRKVSFKVGKY